MLLPGQRAAVAELPAAQRDIYRVTASATGPRGQRGGRPQDIGWTHPDELNEALLAFPG